MLPVIIGAVSAAGSLLGDIFDQSAAKKAKADAINAYKALLIPAAETRRRADMYGDDVYTRTMGELNEGAFAYANALNPETLRTIAFSKMSGMRSQTEIAVTEQDYQYNKGVQQQIAQVQAQPIPPINPMNAITAGAAGYFGGKQLEMAEDLMESQGELMKAQKEDMEYWRTNNKVAYLNPDTVNIADYGLSTNSNPYKKNKKGFGLDLTIPTFPYLPSAKRYIG